MIIACPHCATIQTLPPPPPRGRLECLLCADVLERTTGRSLDGALACAITTILLLFPAVSLPLMTVRAPAGLVSQTHLIGGCALIWRLGWPLMAAILALEGIIFPFLRFGLLVAALAALRHGSRAKWIGLCFRWSQLLDEWAMSDVFLIGGAIGYGRVVALIPVSIDTGGYALIGAALMTMLTRATLDRRAVWRRISSHTRELPPDAIACTDCDLVLPGSLLGRRCPRCAARLNRRKPRSMLRAGALTLAGFVLLPIANLYPMSIFFKEGIEHRQTILVGIKLLFDNGYAPLGVLIFLTSIGFPVAKLFGLSWCLISVRQQSTRRLRFKTKFFRFIAEIGRWSNLDPFTLVIFTPMVQFGQVAHFGVGGGGSAFLAVIVLTMLATDLFDPRLIWDAGRGQASPEARRLRQRGAPASPVIR